MPTADATLPAVPAPHAGDAAHASGSPVVGRTPGTSGAGPDPDTSGTGADAQPTVLAYGGVVWERDAGGRVLVAVVHRPRYDDWSFPKGKAEPGEEPERTALREVEEETGLTCRLGPPLGELRYPTGTGATKVVGYWAMSVAARRERPADDEVDQVAWWAVDEAAAHLTHDQDRELLARFARGEGTPLGSERKGTPPTPLA